MTTRVFGLVVLALSALVAAYLCTGLVSEAPVLITLGSLGALGAAAAGLLMVAQKV